MDFILQLHDYQVLNVTVVYAIYVMFSNTLCCFSLSFSPTALNYFENVVHVTSQKITFQNWVWSLHNAYKKEPDYEAILTSLENTGKVPDQQDAKTGKLSIF